GRDAAEQFVIDEFGDGGGLAAERTERVFAELELAELHIERVEQEQTADERTPFAQRDFQDLRGLDTADDARQHTEHAAFGATGHHARRRWFGIEAAITRPAQVRREDAGLAFEAED